MGGRKESAKAPQKTNTNATKKSRQGNQPRNQKKNPRKADRQLQIAKYPVQQFAANAYATGNHQSTPIAYKTANGEGRRHKEFIGNISGLGNTLLNQAFSIPLNPGLFQSFPWLSFIANNYESYRFRSLRFCYYTRTGSNTAGSVLMVPDYDSSDVIPSTEQIASTYNDMQEDVPWKDMCCVLNAKAMHTLGPFKFVRSGGVVGDIKTYDSGNMFVFTVDSAGAAPWGKLWVEYDCEFMTPQLNPNGTVQSAQIVGQPAGSMTAALPFGTAPVLSFSSSTIFSYSNATALLTFNQNYSGDFSVSVVGTVLGAASFGGGSATVTNAVNVTNAAATAISSTCTIVALAGQTLQYGIAAATTITSVRGVMSQSLF